MKTLAIVLTIILTSAAAAVEHHVSVNGPLKSISEAAQLAQPGDVITVHEGIYRERVTPPRGGESDAKRITYQAAPGAKVVITGSEIVKGWEPVGGDTWKVTLPNKFFGDFNPYADRIHGDWFDPQGRQHHTGAVYLNGEWLTEAASHLNEVLQPAGKVPLWFARVDDAEDADPKSGSDNTTIWAQFPGVNPNEANVEINVRKTVFTPDKPGIDYLTVRGFSLCHAATNWAPPTAGQIGLVSAYWCKGWIIENNDIAYSKCSGVALGKYSDDWDNRAESAEGYVGTLTRALANGWNKATVGGHVVRNNHIHHCEQTGIVGSLGCSFSSVTGNEIHEIHVQQRFGGAEMAGIKFHGAIDVVIRDNHIYRCGEIGGIWLDWMAQGAQVTGNLLHDNWSRDIFCEMQHGPLLIANNLLLSRTNAFLVNAKGLAIVHNLIVRPFEIIPYDDRNTPFHQAHSTEVAGLHDAPGGDHRFYNNLVVGPCNLPDFDQAKLPCFGGGNVFAQGARSAKFETGALVQPDFDAGVSLEQKPDGWYLTIAVDEAWKKEQSRQLVTTALLGKAKIPDLPYENADGTPLQLDTDYFGRQREVGNPAPGPLETSQNGVQTLKVWPKPNSK